MFGVLFEPGTEADEQRAEHEQPDEGPIETKPPDP